MSVYGTGFSWREPWSVRATAPRQFPLHPYRACYLRSWCGQREDYRATDISLLRSYGAGMWLIGALSTRPNSRGCAPPTASRTPEIYLAS
jgi:hypothetical protein